MKLGNKLLQRVPSNSIAAIGFIQSRAATETNRKNYARALKDFHWLRNRKTGTEPKTLFTQMARCYDALGNPKLAYTYMDSARMWTDTLAQHNLTQQMAEFNVKYHTQEKELEIAHLQQEQLEHQAFLLKASIAVALLSGLALITLLTLRHKKRIAEKKIELLKQENELNSARRYIEGLEEECKYFAKELHDGIANDLLGLQMKIETSAGKGNEQELASLVSKLRNNVRNISHELMPPEFEHLSLDQILDRYAAKLTENTGIEVSYHPTENNASRHLPNETAYELYRIVQELTMNIVKHASASHIVISLRADNENKYTLQITDNGKNANKQQTATNNNDGIGLRTVNDRIRAINATANVCSSTENNVFTLLLNIKRMKPNKETYRILVIDDHPIVAEGIIALASQLEGVTCKGATCAKDVEQLTLKERFDLCIIDLELPDMNGFQLISHLHSQIPECGILIYTMHEEPWIIAKLSTLNINGAVSKNASTSELRDAISTLKNGTRYFSNVFSELDKEKQNTLPYALPELSRREKEVLAYLSQGLSTSEISQLLFLSINTIQTYRKR